MDPLLTPSIPTRIIRAVEWRKSSYSGSGNCVEVAALPDCRLVRDSKMADGPVLVVSTAGFEAVLRDLREGRLG